MADQTAENSANWDLVLADVRVADIYASGTTWPAHNYYSGPRQFVPGNGGDINDVWVGGTFEGYTQLLAGIDGAPAPFRVFALTDPSRLVVDVVDESAE